jgi:hypothetical protein
VKWKASGVPDREDENNGAIMHWLKREPAMYQAIDRGYWFGL